MACDSVISAPIGSGNHGQSPASSTAPEVSFQS